MLFDTDYDRWWRDRSASEDRLLRDEPFLEKYADMPSFWRSFFASLVCVVAPLSYGVPWPPEFFRRVQASRETVHRIHFAAIEGEVRF